MSTTLKGSLDGLDTKDVHEISRLARKYSYDVTASGGGTLRFKIEIYDPGQIGIGVDNVKGRWRTLLDRDKIDSGRKCGGTIDVPKLTTTDSRALKVIFSRGVGTKGVGYDFFMEPA